jgi:cytoskeletal protein CcmA (bactofilin family)
MSFWNNIEKSVTDGEPGAAVAQPVPERQESTKMMMKRDEAPVVPAASDLLLGRGARFEGKLTFEGTVRIDATFLGSIVTNDVLVVGEAARIDADITCGTIVVHGEVNGNIKAKTAVEIHHTARVRGDLETPSLLIQKGALFQGASRMEPKGAARVESQAAARVESQIVPRVEAPVAPRVEAPVAPRVEAPVSPRVEAQAASRAETGGKPATMKAAAPGK